MTDDRGMPVPKNYETRKIIWKVGDINTSIQIYPTIKNYNDQISKWNFVNVAWQDIDGTRFIKHEKLVDNGTLNSIIENIDELLKKSVDSLSKKNVTDLKQAGGK
jgi:hypothetical protein